LHCSASKPTSNRLLRRLGQNIHLRRIINSIRPQTVNTINPPLSSNIIPPQHKGWIPSRNRRIISPYPNLRMSSRNNILLQSRNVKRPRRLDPQPRLQSLTIRYIPSKRKPRPLHPSLENHTIHHHTYHKRHRCSVPPPTNPLTTV
jgi:hypothetical protein